MVASIHSREYNNDKEVILFKDQENMKKTQNLRK